jgi:hypothetical protein
VLNKQDRDNAAACNILNLTGMPFPQQATIAVPTKELTKILAALRPAVREPRHDLQGSSCYAGKRTYDDRNASWR